ncbi:MAG: hypothetical protein MHM6MM_004644 [Cercozoa sp. M6MM]
MGLQSTVVESETRLKTVWMERNIMELLQSPFLVHVLYCFQDEHECYLVMPFLQGGDLRYYLHTYGAMSEDMCRFYACEIILGLEELHSYNIVYRDLKPDNLLFDAEGHIRISDFGIADHLRPRNRFRTSGKSGTDLYLAPEVIQRKKYTTTVDMWALGVTLYEFLFLHRPFKSNSKAATSPLRFDSNREISAEAESLLRGLLQKDPKKRLGCGRDGIDEIKRHPFFRDIDWDKMLSREVKPPHQPDLDRANCVSDFDLEDQLVGNTGPVRHLTPEEQGKFRGFEYNAVVAEPDPRRNRVWVPSARRRRISVSLNKPLEPGYLTKYFTMAADAAAEEGDPRDDEDDDDVDDDDDVYASLDETTAADLDDEKRDDAGGT